MDYYSAHEDILFHIVLDFCYLFMKYGFYALGWRYYQQLLYRIFIICGAQSLCPIIPTTKILSEEHEFLYRTWMETVILVKYATEPGWRELFWSDMPLNLDRDCYFGQICHQIEIKSAFGGSQGQDELRYPLVKYFLSLQSSFCSLTSKLVVCPTLGFLANRILLAKKVVGGLSSSRIPCRADFARQEASWWFVQL